MRNILCYVLTLTLLLAFAPAVQAAEQGPDLGRWWQLIQQLFPDFGAPEKTGASIDPSGGDQGPEMDPDGFVYLPPSDTDSGMDPDGLDEGPGLDPNGLSDTGSSIDPDGGQ